MFDDYDFTDVTLEKVNDKLNGKNTMQIELVESQDLVKEQESQEKKDNDNDQEDMKRKKSLLLGQTIDIFKMYAKFANPDHIDQKKNAHRKKYLMEEILKDQETLDLIHQQALRVDTETIIEQNLKTKKLWNQTTSSTTRIYQDKEQEDQEGEEEEEIQNHAKISDISEEKDEQQEEEEKYRSDNEEERQEVNSMVQEEKAEEKYSSNNSIKKRKYPDEKANGIDSPRFSVRSSESSSSTKSFKPTSPKKKKKEPLSDQEDKEEFFHSPQDMIDIEAIKNSCERICREIKQKMRTDTIHWNKENWMLYEHKLLNQEKEYKAIQRVKIGGSFVAYGVQELTEKYRPFGARGKNWQNVWDRSYDEKYQHILLKQIQSGQYAILTDMSDNMDLAWTMFTDFATNSSEIHKQENHENTSNPSFNTNKDQELYTSKFTKKKKKVKSRDLLQMLEKNTILSDKEKKKMMKLIKKKNQKHKKSKDKTHTKSVVLDEDILPSKEIKKQPEEPKEVSIAPIVLEEKPIVNGPPQVSIGAEIPVVIQPSISQSSLSASRMAFLNKKRPGK